VPEDESFSEAAGDPAALIAEQDCSVPAGDVWCYAWESMLAPLE